MKPLNHKLPLSPEDLLTHLHSAWLLVSRQGEILSMNPAAERLFSLSLTIARGQILSQWIGEKHPLWESLQEVLHEGRTVRLHEVSLHTKAGKFRLSAELAPLGNLENPEAGLLWLTEDSIHQALQEDHRLQDRLKMMGTLASGLAHEIRNPLGGIRAAAQMLRRGANQEEPPEDLKEYTSIIIGEVDRLNQLITELLDFAKPKRIHKGAVNIHKLLTEILKLEQNQLDKNQIQVLKNFDPSLPSVHGHGPSLKQAFLNLIKNAMEAMVQGGTLKIKTKVSSEKRLIKEAHQDNLSSGLETFAEISIEDSGVGISLENQEALFTPFFTTKTSGTGLGLMMVQRIIKEHGGTLKISSEVGKGSCFSIFLKLDL